MAARPGDFFFGRARRLGAPSHRVSPCGASFFPSDGKETKGSPGDGSGWTLRVHIRLTPGPPLRGTRTCWILQHFRRAKSERLVSIPAGPLGPGWMENCGGCNSTAAPSLAEQVIAGPSSSGRSGTGPYERRDSFCIRRRGGCPHPPVPPPERDSWKNQAAKRSFAQSSFGYFSSKKSNASSRV